jgi:hypothetical protein
MTKRAGKQYPRVIWPRRAGGRRAFGILRAIPARRRDECTINSPPPSRVVLYGWTNHIDRRDVAANDLDLSCGNFHFTARAARGANCRQAVVCNGSDRAND